VHDLFTVPHSIWFPILPGAAGIFVMFRNAKIGIKTSRWFSQYNKGYIHPSLKHRARTLGVVCLGRLFGADFAKPEFVSLNNAFEIAEWAACMVRYHKRCCIETYASSAVRVCHAASKHSLDISGTTFVVAGEPLSAAKRDEILSAGAQAIPVYAFTEAGAIGYGCANPAEADEVHFLRDSFAFIQHRRKAPYSDRTVDSFLFTSLRSRAPKVLLNVEIGDYGKTESRKCGCGFEKMGFTDHIHTIRSFDKLTSEGMRLEGSHLVRVIEEVLPLKFGGDSTDYQIVEEEDEKGLSRLNVFVNPSIGDVNERELLDTILGEIDIGPIPDIFSQAGTLGIKRAHPIPTPGGKILPLYLKKQKKSL